MLRMFELYEKAKTETFKEVTRIVDICHDVKHSDFPGSFGETVESFEVLDGLIRITTSYTDSFEDYHCSSTDHLPITIIGASDEETKKILTKHFLVKGVYSHKQYIEETTSMLIHHKRTLDYNVKQLKEMEQQLEEGDWHTD